MNQDNLLIYVSTLTKYNNPIIPYLPNLVACRVLEHPERLSMYLSPKVDFTVLFDKFSRHYKEVSLYNKEHRQEIIDEKIERMMFDPLEVVINYVEVGLFGLPKEPKSKSA